MVVVVGAVFGGLLVALALGGRLRYLGGLRLRRTILLALAVVAEVLSVSGVLGQRIGLVASALLAGCFLASNRGVPGLGLLATGLTGNAVAVLANGGAMPVSLTALARIGSGNGGLLTDPVHIAAGSHTRLALLTDRIAVPLPFGLGEVLSAGDVLIAAGAGLVVFAATRHVPESADGEKGQEAARTQEQQGQPREASQRLSQETPTARWGWRRPTRRG